MVEPPGPSRLNLPAPEGRQTGLGLSPLRGWEDIYDRPRWFHHRLISGVPPGRRVIPDLCRNFSRTALRYITHNSRFSSNNLFKQMKTAIDLRSMKASALILGAVSSLTAFFIRMSSHRVLRRAQRERRAPLWPLWPLWLKLFTHLKIAAKP